MMAAKKFIVCNLHGNDTSKRLTNANESEVPLSKNLSAVCFSSNQNCSGFIVNLFAAADIKYFNFRTPSFKFNFNIRTFRFSL